MLRDSWSRLHCVVKRAENFLTPMPVIRTTSQRILASISDPLIGFRAVLVEDQLEMERPLTQSLLTLRLRLRAEVQEVVEVVVVEADHQQDFHSLLQVRLAEVVADLPFREVVMEAEDSQVGALRADLLVLRVEEGVLAGLLGVPGVPTHGGIIRDLPNLRNPSTQRSSK